MVVAGIAMVKNEIDVIKTVIPHMLTQVDFCLVADNGSTDGTFEYLEEHASVEARLHLLVDDDPAYYQSRKMTALAFQARDLGGSWVVPFDADEIWYSPFGTIAEVLAGQPHHLVATAKLYDHVRTGLDVGHGIPDIGWRRRDAVPLKKVACQVRDGLVIEQGNHGAGYDFIPEPIDGLLVVRHFPYRSREQMVRKAVQGGAALQLTDLPEASGAHWRGYSRLVQGGGEETLFGVFDDYFYVEDPTADPSLIFDPAPITGAK